MAKGAGGALTGGRGRGREMERKTLGATILDTAAQIVAGQRIDAVRISTLRSRLPNVSKADLDNELRRLHEARRIVLSRDDNAHRTTAKERAEALMVGDSERHLFYVLKGK